jgi:hypothetical protein
MLLAGAGTPAELTGPEALRETVRERYAAAARATTDPTAAAGALTGADA